MIRNVRVCVIVYSANTENIYSIQHFLNWKPRTYLIIFLSVAAVAAKQGDLDTTYFTVFLLSSSSNVKNNNLTRKW